MNEPWSSISFRKYVRMLWSTAHGGMNESWMPWLKGNLPKLSALCLSGDRNAVMRLLPELSRDRFLDAPAKAKRLTVWQCMEKWLAGGDTFHKTTKDGISPVLTNQFDCLQMTQRFLKRYIRYEKTVKNLKEQKLKARKSASSPPPDTQVQQIPAPHERHA